MEIIRNSSVEISTHEIANYEDRCRDNCLCLATEG